MVIGGILVHNLIHLLWRVHVRKLRTDSQDHQDRADRACVLRGKDGWVGIASVHFLTQPILFNIEIISLRIFEKRLH